MKKIISWILIMTMVVALTACGGGNTEETTGNTESASTTEQQTADIEEEGTDAQTGTETEQTEAVEPVLNEEEQEDTEENANTGSYNPESQKEETKKEEPKKEEPKKEETKTENKKEESKEDKKPAKEENKKEDKEDSKKEENKDTAEDKKEETASATVGQTLLAVFKSKAKADGSVSAQQLADELIGNEVIQFMGGTVPVEPGLLSGFDNAEITGFKEGVMFAPMMGSIAFVGYVFVVEDGTDVDEFKKTLKSNANPRWQICVEAEETIVDSVGNTVFFLMCPRSFEQ